MTARTVSKTKGTSISIRRKLYEKVFSVVSEINFKCGLFLGRGVQQSDIFECLALHFTSKLMGLTEINLSHQLSERSHPGTRKTTVYINGKTSSALENVVSAINVIRKSEDSYITKSDVLELLIIQSLDDALKHYLAIADMNSKEGNIDYYQT